MEPSQNKYNTFYYFCMSGNWHRRLYYVKYQSGFQKVKYIVIKRHKFTICRLGKKEDLNFRVYTITIRRYATNTLSWKSSTRCTEYFHLYSSLNRIVVIIIWNRYKTKIIVAHWYLAQKQQHARKMSYNRLFNFYYW